MMRVISTTAAALVAACLASAALAEHARFANPEAAVEALVAAVTAHDGSVLQIVGPENQDVISTGDPAQDRENADAFLRAYAEMNRIGPTGDGFATLFIGRDQWPFPAPIVKGPDGSWAWDAASAREEVRLRRIGRNELDVIAALRRYVAAQAQYRAMDPDADGLATFAAHVLSAPGKRDGLYWPDEPGAPESPIGDLVARAAAEGLVVDGREAEPEPYLGYYFRILTKQGPAAPGGAIDWMINGRLIGGHAMLAVPADPGQTGIMSFIVTETGAIWEADLGPDTLEEAAAIDAFDPTEPWSLLEDEG
jgi:hypothetical protein